MKTTLEAQEQKAHLFAEAFEIAKIDLSYCALTDEIEKEIPGGWKRGDAILMKMEKELTNKEFSAVSLFLEENLRYDRLEEHGYAFEEIDNAVMLARRLIKREQKAGEITDEVFGD